MKKYILLLFLVGLLQSCTTTQPLSASVDLRYTQTNPDGSMRIGITFNLKGATGAYLDSAVTALSKNILQFEKLRTDSFGAYEDVILNIPALKLPH